MRIRNAERCDTNCCDANSCGKWLPSVTIPSTTVNRTNWTFFENYIIIVYRYYMWEVTWIVKRSVHFCNCFGDTGKRNKEDFGFIHLLLLWTLEETIYFHRKFKALKLEEKLFLDILEWIYLHSHSCPHTFANELKKMSKVWRTSQKCATRINS